MKAYVFLLNRISLLSLISFLHMSLEGQNSINGFLSPGEGKGVASVLLSWRDKESITKGLSKTKQAAMLTEKLGLAALALDTCPLTK